MPPLFPRSRTAIATLAFIAVATLVALFVWLSQPGIELPNAPPEDSAGTMGAFIDVLAIGGALAASLMLDNMRTRFATAAVIGLAAALLRGSLPIPPLSGSILADFALAIAGACGVSGLASIFFSKVTWPVNGSEVRSGLQEIVIPRLWPGSAFAAPLSPPDIVARWFVTIAASTGSIVGTLASEPEFWHAAAAALAPSRVFFTLLLMVVSITLIGPLEEYIFGQKIARAGEVQHDETGGARGVIEEVWKNFSPRAAGRLGLTFLFALQPTLLDACIGETVGRGDTNATFVFISSAFAPAYTTYYWSAALQNGLPSIVKPAGFAATTLTAVIWYPLVATCLVAWSLSGMGEPSQLSKEFLWLLAAVFFVGPLAAWLLALPLAGISALAGAWALDHAKLRHDVESWRAVALLGVVLVAASLVPVIWMIAALARYSHTNMGGVISSLLPITMSMVGWAGGLLVSGFPKILQTARVSPEGRPAAAAMPA